MYNGIGLRTPRGSGTNGYIQRNLAHIARPRQEFIVGLKTNRNKRTVVKPNKLRVDDSIMEHNKKRQIEVLVFKERVKYEDEGKSEEEIEKLVNEYRQKLLDQIENGINVTSQKNEKNEDSHQRTAQKLKQNEKMLNALGLEEDEDGKFVDKRELERMERRESREALQTQQERIKYKLQTMNKHSLDPLWPPRKNKFNDRDHHRHKKRDKNQKEISKRKRKRKRKDYDSSDDTDSSYSSSSESDSRDDSYSDDSSNDAEYSSSDEDRESRRKRIRKHRHGRKHKRDRRDKDDDHDDRRYRRDRNRNRNDDRLRHRHKRSRSRSASLRSRSRSRSRSRNKSSSHSPSNRGRWQDQPSPSKSMSPNKQPNNHIVPDFV